MKELCRKCGRELVAASESESGLCARCGFRSIHPSNEKGCFKCQATDCRLRFDDDKPCPGYRGKK